MHHGKSIQYLKCFMPSGVEGVPEHVLDPRNLWEDKENYTVKALELQKSLMTILKSLKMFLKT